MATGFAIYYWATSDHRTEQQAVDALRCRAAGRSSESGFPRTVSLERGLWAREKEVVDEVRWQFERTESSAFPFRATQTTIRRRFATVYHSSLAEAERDDRFYQYNGKSFRSQGDLYDQSISILFRREQEVEKLLYEKAKGGWISQGVETTWVR
jgi:hypothetical protein